MAATQAWFADKQYTALQFIFVAASFVLSVAPAGFDYSIADDPLAEAGPPPSNPWFKIQWSVLCALALWIVWRRRRLALKLVPEINPLLIAFLAWCACTAFWAVEPMKTFTQTLSMVFVTIVAFASTLSAWQPGSFARFLRPVLTTILLISVVVALGDPAVGLESGDQFELQGSWRGMTLTKNVLGQAGAIAIIFWLHAWAARQTRSLTAFLGFVLSVFVMLKSRSSTSLFLSILSGGILVAMLRSPIEFQGKRAIAWLSASLVAFTPIFIYLVIVGSFAYDDIASPIGHAVGKDATFSGRTLIWAEVWQTIQNHRWLGVGFMGFWNGPDSLAGDILRQLKWPVPHSHDGYLDIWNETGIIGILLFTGFIVFHFRQLFKLDSRNRESFALHFVIMPYLILENVTETGWFRPISMTLLLSLYSSVDVSRLLFEQRLRDMLDRASTNNALAPV